MIAVIALLGALAVSQRGLTGSISHDVSSLTNPNAPVPANRPGRLTAVGSVRARYWNEALEIFTAHPLLGAGAEGYATARLRYRTATLDVRHAHGFVVQTLADLGLVGLVLGLALLRRGWPRPAAPRTPSTAAGRRWRWRRSRRRAYTPERVGLLTMVCVVVTFGVHSLVDWTWYVPGDACVALLCAGWLAGRGPSAREAPLHPLTRKTAPRSTNEATPRSTQRLGIAAAVLALALLSAWAQWQPQRSFDAANEASALVARNPRAALAAAQRAIGRDPLSARPC